MYPNKRIQFKKFYGLCLNLMHDHRFRGTEETYWQSTAPKDDTIPGILNFKLLKEKCSL